MSIPIQAKQHLDYLTKENLKARVKDLKEANEAQQQSLSPEEKVAEEFEALFMDLVLKSMRRTAQPESQSNAQEIYTSMLDSEYSKTMAGSHKFGIKELILDWIQTHSKSSTPELDHTTLNPTTIQKLEDMKNSRQRMKMYDLQAQMFPQSK